jgi:hypothetical protein
MSSTRVFSSKTALSIPLLPRNFPQGIPVEGILSSSRSVSPVGRSYPLHAPAAAAKARAWQAGAHEDARKRGLVPVGRDRRRGLANRRDRSNHRPAPAEGCGQQGGAAAADPVLGWKSSTPCCGTCSSSAPLQGEIHLALLDDRAVLHQEVAGAPGAPPRYRWGLARRQPGRSGWAGTGRRRSPSRDAGPASRPAPVLWPRMAGEEGLSPPSPAESPPQGSAR